MSAPVFNSLVGQEAAISQLERALSSNETRNEMTHAWLFTGPPGSGRSVIAHSFAAALVCKKKGCGECSDCTSVLAGSHQDVEIMKIDGLTIKVDEIRDVISRSSWSTTTSNWRVIVVEDSDRMTESAANALLKSLEDPGSSSVWLLSAPSLDDVLPTVRSRCRQVHLRIPTTQEIKDFLLKTLNANPDEAEYAARVSQGHIGKARASIRDKELLTSRRVIFEILFKVTSEARALFAAAKLIDLAEERVSARFAQLPKESERDQELKATRAIKDEIDGYLLDYMSFLRDCLLLEGPWINVDLSDQTKSFQWKIRAEDLSGLLSLLANSRKKLFTNASQTLVLEALFLSFAQSLRGN